MPHRQLIARMQMTLRGRNVLAHLFELWVGLAGIVTGIVFFYSPASIDGNALDQTIGYAASTVWTVAYTVAGLCIWYGLLRPAIRWEVFGLWLLGGATAANGVAILSVFGTRGVATIAITIALSVASWGRALIITTSATKVAQEASADGH